MSNIGNIDKNMQVDTSLELSDVVFYDVRQSPLSLHGVFWEDGKFRRLPEQVAKSVNDGVLALHAHTAGGRVRFRTDSPYVAIHAEMPPFYRMNHFALTGSASFDLYVKREEGYRFAGVYTRPDDSKEGYERVLELPFTGMQEYLIHFPTYADVNQVYIGLSKDAKVEAPAPYDIETPVVFYGSSITEGACASRPGSAYDALVSARIHCDYINLGFSGSARGEQEMARYIAGLNMSALVLDYDHNAPSPEHLANTHQAFYKTIRQAHPDIPVLILSKPQYGQNEDTLARLAVITKTYEEAKAAGENVYLLTGKELMALAKYDGMVDIHPNDFGFASMAQAVTEQLQRALK